MKNAITELSRNYEVDNDLDDDMEIIKRANHFFM